MLYFLTDIFAPLPEFNNLNWGGVWVEPAAYTRNAPVTGVVSCSTIYSILTLVYQGALIEHKIQAFCEEGM